MENLPTGHRNISMVILLQLIQKEQLSVKGEKNYFKYYGKLSSRLAKARSGQVNDSH